MTEDSNVSEGAWGMDEHGEVVTAEHAAHQIIEDAIRAYVNQAVRIMECGDHDAKTLHEMRWGPLAEPWLPASEALSAMRDAGLVVALRGESK